MRGKPITKREIEIIEQMRRTGHSLPEICKTLKRRCSTIHRFVKEIKILPEYVSVLREKQGGSKMRAKKLWNKSIDDARKLLGEISERDKLFILAAIYWGEGTKKELNLINSDPNLIKTFVSCLGSIGITEKDLRITIRIYDCIDASEAKKYWAEVCGVDLDKILNVNVIKGKKEGKLKYGMCRVRVAKGGDTFKLIISMIDLIKNQITCSRSSVDRTRDS